MIMATDIPAVANRRTQGTVNTQAVGILTEQFHPPRWTHTHASRSTFINGFRGGRQYGGM